MYIPFYQVDAFSDGPFSGNPAAVCLMTSWPDDSVLQKIAQENNLSETAFYVNNAAEGTQNLRWFTPATEVDLCGHATLATAAVLFEMHQSGVNELAFYTRSGLLSVRREGHFYSMNFPAVHASVTDRPVGLEEALGLLPGDVDAVLVASDLIVVLHDESKLDSLQPDFVRLATSPHRGVVVTAKSGDDSFRSRWFGPQVGVNEDPVTGSAHTFLAPYWAGRLGKNTLSAVQGGTRKGRLTCRLIGDGRVELVGEARLVIRGEFILP
ncbi:PhzF family phenazine biosynthesis protein [Enterobacter kobei]|uniref:PhzF family phenazine biosynthesis protein n=1 Tax=Enterobacter kobei TaxID=208224 RepID=UPI003CF384FE